MCALFSPEILQAVAVKGLKEEGEANRVYPSICDAMEIALLKGNIHLTVQHILG